MRDEVYVLCQMVRVLARTFLQQKILAQTMEQRIMGMPPCLLSSPPLFPPLFPLSSIPEFYDIYTVKAHFHDN